MPYYYGTTMWNEKYVPISQTGSPVCINVMTVVSRVKRVRQSFYFVRDVIQNHKIIISQNTAVLTLRRLMSYIYGAPILDVSRSHTTTQHSR